MPAPANPRVSVVIPLFQKAPYVRRALDSVFHQTFEQFEVIVVDDGSTDEAPQVLAAIDDRRLTVHRQEHAGVSAARNAGVSLARASWVAFLDADDEWRPAFLESTLRIAEAAPRVSAVFTNLCDYPSGWPMVNAVKTAAGVVEDYFDALTQNNGVGMSSSSVLVSRSGLSAAGGFLEGVEHGQDTEAWARLAWSGDIAFCDEVLVVYHSEVPDSASKDVLRAIRPYPAFLSSYEKWNGTSRIPVGLRESTRRYAHWILARNVMELAHHGLREEARHRLKSAAWCDENDPHILRARIWTVLPTAVLRLGRRVRRRLSRGPSRR